MISESDVERLPAALAARLALESNPESGHSSGHDASEESVQCMQGKDKGSRGSLVLDSGAPRSSKGRRESATGIVDILSRIGEMGHDEETGHDDHVINFSSAVSDVCIMSVSLSLCMYIYMYLYVSCLFSLLSFRICWCCSSFFQCLYPSTILSLSLYLSIFSHSLA